MKLTLITLTTLSLLLSSTQSLPLPQPIAPNLPAAAGGVITGAISGNKIGQTAHAIITTAPRLLNAYKLPAGTAVYYIDSNGIPRGGFGPGGRYFKFNVKELVNGKPPSEIAKTFLSGEWSRDDLKKAATRITGRVDKSVVEGLETYCAYLVWLWYCVKKG